MNEPTIETVFDTAMRDPRSGRGMLVEETCHILALEIRRIWPESVLEKFDEMEAFYIEQFLHTSLVYPGFVALVQTEFQRHRAVASVD